jgi:hypothetical protein
MSDATILSPGVGSIISEITNLGLSITEGGAVLSVFGRTGAIIAQSGDYNFGQISGTLSLAQLPAVLTSVTTVAALPAAATAGVGARAFVTDSVTTTFASLPIGGGSVNVPVYSDGARWLVG